MNNKKFISSNILITALTLVSVGVSFISQIVLAYYFGASAERDAYFSAIVVPTYVVTLFTGSFVVIILPFYVEFRRKNEPQAVRKLTSNIFGLCTILLTSIAVIGFLASEYIVSWTAPGFDADQLLATRRLFDIIIFSIIFQSLSSFFSIFYHVENRFLLPAISPIAVPLTSLVFIVLFNQYGIISLAIGSLTGSVISALILVHILRGKITFRYFFSFINDDIIALLKLTLPLFISGAVYRLTTVIERIIASKLPSGSISYLGYGSQIYLLLASIASGSIATTFYPSMSEAWAAGDREMFNNYVSRGIRLILFVTLPIAAVLLVLSFPVIGILFERGAFTGEATVAVAKTLSILMGALIFGSLGNVIVKLFYITKKTTTVSVISIIEVAAYLVIGYSLSVYYSYEGLASALTISTGLTILLSVIILRRSKIVSFAGLPWDVLKLMAAAALCGVTAHIMYLLLSILNLNAVVTTGLSVLISFVVYSVTALFVFRFRDSALIVTMVRSYF